MATSSIRPGAVQALLRVSPGNASLSTDETMTPASTSSHSSLTSSPPVRHGFTIQSSPRRKDRTVNDCANTNAATSSFSATGLTIRRDSNPVSLFSSTASHSNQTNTNNNDRHRPRSGSSALDALATLASSAHKQNEDMDVNDFEGMPPPPPRRKVLVRQRSASNPEGMEKWDSYRAHPNSRMHFVLPSTILEEELENANFACKEHQKKLDTNKIQMKIDHQDYSHHFGPSRKMSRPIRRTAMTDFSIIAQPDVDQSYDLHGTSPTTIINMSMPSKSKGSSSSKSASSTASSSSSSTTSKKGQKKNKSQKVEQANKASVESDLEEEEVIDESKLEPEELLRRARSKLFEDLSAENGGLEKGVTAFPHSLEKYKEIYNKNGRIGIYTPAERAAIIAKFNSKRTRRTWKKKIRYNCRKNLADRRMRVKGRFVKRAVEQTQTKTQKVARGSVPVSVPDESVMVDTSTVTADMNRRARSNSEGGISDIALVTPTESSSDSADSSRTSSPVNLNHSILAPVQEDMDMDVDMPDVEDPDAGFKPTVSQPFKRTRRHTIT